MKTSIIKRAVLLPTTPFAPPTFFTTKPTGQGTGLSLTLAYNIFKAQGGDFSVESSEHEGSAFIIQIPLTNA